MSARFRILVEAVTVLADEPAQQLEHLRKLGFSPGAESIDELALDFDDIFRASDDMLQRREIDPAQHAALSRIDSLLTQMSAQANVALWTPAAVRDSTEWRVLRGAARDLLASLKDPS